MPVAPPSGFVIYVRSQPIDAHAEFQPVGPLVRLLGTTASNEPHDIGGPEAAGPGPPPQIGLPPQESQCLALVLDLARRMRTPVRVIDASRELVPRDILEDGRGEPRFFPVLVRSDGARLSGEEEFLPGRVKRFLKGR